MAIAESKVFLCCPTAATLERVRLLIVFAFPFQVQWDELASIQRPDRVSPWEIEPFVAPTPSIPHSISVKNKRPRPPLEIPGIAVG